MQHAWISHGIADQHRTELSRSAATHRLAAGGLEAACDPGAERAPRRPGAFAAALAVLRAFPGRPHPARWTPAPAAVAGRRRR